MRAEIMAHNDAQHASLSGTFMEGITRIAIQLDAKFEKLVLGESIITHMQVSVQWLRISVLPGGSPHPTTPMPAWGAQISLKAVI